MREANPRAHLTRLVSDRNYLGAQLYLREADLERDERNELLGMLATAVVDELSRTRRDDRERIVYLRSVLAWILREVPGLGSMYREQLRSSAGGGDVVSQFARGMRTFGDVAAGRTSFTDAADEARHNFEEATERFRSGESSDQMNDFLSSAEKGIRDGLDQLGAFFQALNEDRESREGPVAGEEASGPDEEARAAARADSESDVEDAEFAPEDEGQDINVERE
ncbi:MAG: hypothetical protein ACOC6J_06000 [Spirochaetota bacterium]